MKKNIAITCVWIFSIIFSVLWTFENPEKIEKIKSNFKKNKKPEISKSQELTESVIANSYKVSFTRILELTNKTAFVSYPKNLAKLNIEELNIYTQNGYLIKNFDSKKLNLPKSFTLQRNGGVKTIISIENKKLALISATKSNCFFASLNNVETSEEIFKTKCLPEEAKNNDFNGLGSSNVHLKNSILLSLGTPEKHASKNSKLAQKDDSMFGKILKIKKIDLIEKLNKKKENELKIKIFSKGHRVPQGLTVLNNKIFNVEHGPKGGDELNLVVEGNNYGWPNVSYGTNYLKDGGGDGSSYKINHEKNNYQEPLFAFVPSVGISSLNNCPKILKDYYKKSCLLALSLYGNNLRKGHSMIIFLLNEENNKVVSIEKISLSNLVLRHFVTDEQNNLYEDEDGNIFISADKKGIYKIKFSEFR
jgi:hypothetical protein